VRVIATAGHVDHGKSSLVLALTGTDPDRWDEEKRRGLTIDLGFAHTAFPTGEEIAFVDVPGHVRFLRNMLAGVGGVDACLFVVAATEGWKPQSEEHLRILTLLGVEHGVVALTKVDVVDDERRGLARGEIVERTVGTFLAGAPIVPVGVPTGEGLDDLRAALGRLAGSVPAATDRGRPRLWIDRSFAAKGSGTVVTGVLAGGSISTGDRVVVGEQERPVRVRSIQTLGRVVDRADPGSRVALNLAGIDHSHARRGDAVVQPGRWRPTARLDCSLTVLPALDHEVGRRGAYVAYVGSGEHTVRLRVLGAEALAPGATGLVRLHLSRRLPVLPGDRYVLRESGRQETVGGGEILDVAPVVPASRARPDRDVDRVVAERGWIEADELEALTGEQRGPTVDQWVVAPGALAAARSALVDRVRAAGPFGLDLAALDDRERAMVAHVAEVVVDGGRARLATAGDPLVDHPVVAILRAGGLAPPEPSGFDRAELRALVRRGVVVERDGLYFSASAIDDAAALAATLLSRAPDGFTVSGFREAAGITRKHALPLLSELDARGVTRRRDDVRIAGPRLPAGAVSAGGGSGAAGASSGAGPARRPSGRS
jgi:selenocysteine-specific elongation factor